MEGGVRPTEDDAVEEARNAEDYVGEGVKVLRQSMVWKLNSDGDAHRPEHWLKRKMWLTDCGSMYYFSVRMNVPLGKHLSGVRVDIVNGAKLEYAHPCCVELSKPGLGEEKQQPTALAFESSEVRDEWIKSFQPFQEQEDLQSLNSEARRTSRSLKHAKPRKRMKNLFKLTALDEVDGTFVSEGSRSSEIPSSSAPRVDSLASSEVGELRSLSRRESQACFAERMNTTLILDWDDTIFPTTWVRDDCGLNWRLPAAKQLTGHQRTFIENQLAKLSSELLVFFEKACSLCQVVIVSLAKRPWIEKVATNFIPDVWKLLTQKHKLRVIYAQDGISEDMRREYAKDDFKSDEQVTSFWTRTKSVAIAREIEQNSRTYVGQSWKNIISFGDSDFERYGTCEATLHYMQQHLAIEKAGPTLEGVDKDGHFRRVRTKTVKLLDEPTVEELLAQVSLLRHWLEDIVRKDEGFDLEFTSSEDNEALNAMHFQMTGQHADLKWAELAGISAE